MSNDKISPNFWYENISKSLGKHNILPHAWERICKIRNSPIRLIEDFIIGESHKPHRVIPKGYKGYIIDYPECFNLSDQDLEDIETTSRFLHEDLKGIPACFYRVEHVVFLFDYHYEIIDPYFDMNLADYGYENILFG